LVSRNDILEAVLAAVRDTNVVLPPDRSLEASEQAGLLEPAGRLDSLGLVNLIVAVENRCQSALGTTISLVDAVAMPLEANPFQTVRSLVDHLERALTTGAAHA
jgi:acyl carrier protein